MKNKNSLSKDIHLNLSKKCIQLKKCGKHDMILVLRGCLNGGSPFVPVSKVREKNLVTTKRSIKTIKNASFMYLLQLVLQVLNPKLN